MFVVVLTIVLVNIIVSLVVYDWSIEEILIESLMVGVFSAVTFIIASYLQSRKGQSR
jgi:uncharacterized membrane protein (UPF0136 family)